MELPLEIIDHILSYLPHGELLVASQICKSWYAIARRLIGKKDTSLTITPLYLKNDNFKREVLNGVDPIKASTIKLNQIYLDVIPGWFWGKNGPYVKELIFSGSDPVNRIKSIVDKCPNLERLSVEEYAEDIRMKMVDFKLEKLTHLKILTCGKLYVDPLDILKNNPNLAELLLSRCAPGFQNSFNFPDLERRTEPCLTFPKLKALRLNNVFVTHQTFANLSDNLNIKLEELGLWSCYDINFDTISVLHAKQNTLTSLSIVSCRHLNDLVLSTIGANLTGLKKLDISKSINLTDSGLETLHLLTRLRDLNLNECKKITSSGLEKFFQNSSCLLKSLNLGWIFVTENTIMMMVDAFPTLSNLCLDYCSFGLTDKAMQCIIGGLTDLESLSMVSCHKVSTYGFAGTCYFVHKNRSVMDDLSIMQRYSSGDGITRHKLSDLKRLTVLNLSKCNLNDVSVFKAFNFKNLLSLTLNNCVLITLTSIEFLTNRCPTIEVLKLKYCSGVCDKGVMAIAKNLHNLRELYLTGCYKITNNCVPAIYNHCKMLRVLDISSCPGINCRSYELLRQYPIHTIRADFFYSLWSKNCFYRGYH